MKISHRLALVAASTLAMMAATTAFADDFHGFDPANFNGAMLSADQLKAMVADAMKVAPPKNGKNYVFGFANLQRDIPFGVFVEKGIQQNADAAGVQLQIADNRLDGPTALANAQSFAQRNVDFVIEFQTDVNFGPQVMKVFNDANIKVNASSAMAVRSPVPTEPSSCTRGYAPLASATTMAISRTKLNPNCLYAADGGTSGVYTNRSRAREERAVKAMSRSPPPLSRRLQPPSFPPKRESIFGDVPDRRSLWAGTGFPRARE